MDTVIELLSPGVVDTTGLSIVDKVNNAAVLGLFRAYIVVYSNFEGSVLLNVV